MYTFQLEAGRVIAANGSHDAALRLHVLLTWGLDSKTVRATVPRECRLVGRMCGHKVYLHNGVQRPMLRAKTPCRLTSASNAS